MGILLSSQLSMITVALALLILASAAQAGQAEQPKDILCDICVDVVTDVDEWVTSDSTMDEIIQFVENLCSLLSFDPYLEGICDFIIEHNLPEIINGLVNDNLNPSEVCQNIGMCAKPDTTAAPETTTTTAGPVRMARL